MKKIKFISDEGLTYALFKDKEYTTIYESEENYLVPNEVQGISTVPKDKFMVVDGSKDVEGESVGIRYIECDGCSNKIQINQRAYKKQAECGIYCSPKCFTENHAQSIKLTEDEADNCFKEVLEV